MKLNLPDKIVEAIKSMYHEDRLEYYANFLGFVDFYEVKPETLGMPTFAVTLHKLRMAMLWTEHDLKQLEGANLKWKLFHELSHLICNHIPRSKNYKQNVANVAQDMIINHIAEKYYGSETPYKYVPRPFSQEDYEWFKSRGISEQEDKTLREAIGTNNLRPKLDPAYTGDLVFEPLYEWLMQQHQKDLDGKPYEMSEDTAKMMRTLNGTIDAHMELDELSDELRQQIVHAASEKSRQRSRWSPESVDQVLNLLLKKPKQDNLRLIKKTIAQVKGFVKNPTYRRPSRRIDNGKGNVKLGKGLTVIWDWSGSMWGEHERVACELYKDGYSLDVIGSDTEVRKVYKVTSKKELAKVPFSGNGGTELQPAINYVADAKNRLNNKPLVILTDGCTDQLDFSGFKQPVLILSVDRPCPLVVESDNVRQIVIEK